MSKTHLLFLIPGLLVTLGCSALPEDRSLRGSIETASGPEATSLAHRRKWRNTGGSKATGGTSATGGAKATGGATATGGAKATGGATATGGAEATGGATATGGIAGSGGNSPAAGGSQGSGLSTEVGRHDWVDYGVVAAAPPVNFFVGAWTNTLATSGSKGNDYPFVIPCTNGDSIIFVSGNIGLDTQAGSWVYNANTMTNSGDHVTVYERTTEKSAHGWVYVGWHFQRVGNSTITTEYVKFGADGPMKRVSQDTEARLYTPTNVRIGGGDGNWSTFYMQYARLYAMASAPSVAEVDAIAKRTTADPSAWGDWPMLNAGTQDVSGNGRHIAVSGSWYPGIAGPSL